MTPLALFILERLTPTLKNYKYPVMAQEMGVAPREWLEAVKQLVKWHYAEAQNVDRDIVAVRQLLSPHPIFFIDGHERVIMRKVLGSEQRPVWIKEKGTSIIPTPVAMLNPDTLKTIGMVTTVGYTRYEDLWLIETTPAEMLAVTA